MTLESTVSRETFVGNGTTKTFSFTFRVWDTTQILVYRQVTNYSEDDCTSECSIELNDGVAGGTVTFGTAPASGVVIAVVRNMPFVQEDVYNNGVKFDAKEIEDRFDQDCAERQQLLLGVTQAVKVPNTDSRTAEEYAQDFWEAVQDTETNRTTSENCADRACSCADTACEAAEKAEEERIKAGQLAVLGGTAENLEETWTLPSAVSAGSTLTIPIAYYPKRAVLRLSYGGVVLYCGQQYEEVGDDADTPSWEVKALIDLDAGATMHAWTVMSNVSKYASDLTEMMRQAEEEMVATKDSCLDEMTEKLADYLEEAETCRDEACGCASNAKQSQEIAENASAEATEQADRADDAAVDAAEAAEVAKRAAVCAYRYRGGRILAAVQSEDVLADCPNGFYVINPNIAVPATIQHSLIPIPNEDALPTDCDGFYVFGPAFLRDPCPDPDDSGSGGSGSGSGTGTTASSRSMMMPCGKRSRFDTAAS